MLAYAKQFYLSRRAPVQGSFTSIEIGHEYLINTHKDLPVSFLKRGAFGGVLLGLAVSPDQVKFGNDQILSSLVRCFKEGNDELWRYLDSLSGRFVVALWSDEKLHVYHDAFSSKPVYYSKSSGCIASHPALLEALCDEVVLDKAELDEFSHQRNSGAWPLGKLPYSDVAQLPANFYLDALEFTSHRYWPRANSVSAHAGLTTLEAAQAFHAKLRDIILALGHRAKLSFPVTAGYDSRLLLACCPDEIKDSANFFTVLSYGACEGESGLDTPEYEARTAQQLSSLLGLNHSSFDVVPSPPDDVLLRNCSYLLTDKTKYRLDGFVGATQGTLFCSGNGPEVFRCYYYPGGNHPKEANISPEYLAAISGFANNSLALDGISSWLSGLPEDLPISVLDLFYWEDRMGSWQSTVTTFREAVMDEVLPCNSRDLISIALARPVEERRYPHSFVKAVIAQADPNLASIPFNTGGWREDIRSSLRSRIKHWVSLYPVSFKVLDESRRMIKKGMGK